MKKESKLFCVLFLFNMKAGYTKLKKSKKSFGTQFCEFLNYWAKQARI